MAKPRRFTYDLALADTRNPVAGDVMVGPQAIYLVVEARPVDSKVWGNRWALTVERIGTAGHGVGWLDRIETGARSWSFTSYRPGQTPADYFRETA